MGPQQGFRDFLITDFVSFTFSNTMGKWDPNKVLGTFIIVFVIFYFVL
jgi:hypothetical protein